MTEPANANSTRRMSRFEKTPRTAVSDSPMRSRIVASTQRQSQELTRR